MHSFLTEIIENLKRVEVEKLAGPPDEVGEDDYVAGVMGEELKRLWGLREEMRRKLRELEQALRLIKIQHFGVPDLPPKFIELSREFCLADSDDDAMNELFWAAVRRDFPEIAEHPVIGVRKGWRVVWRTEDEEEKHPLVTIIQLLKGHGPLPQTPPPHLIN